jgi:hypothetical protein
MSNCIKLNTQGGRTTIRVAAISAVTLTKNGGELRVFTGDNTMFTVNSDVEENKQQYEAISALLCQ